MKEQFKSFLNEEQDPKAIEKISAKLSDLLMKNEEVGYIGVQKKPAINVFPDSVVLTNKRIIICKPKNLGLSMDFTDYPWGNVAGTYMKENILGSEFSFTTSTDITVSIDYIPKIQARKMYTFAKEQLELLKEVHAPAKPEETVAQAPVEAPVLTAEPIDVEEEIEEVETEEVSSFSELVHHNPTPTPEPVAYKEEVTAPAVVTPAATEKTGLASLSKEELFEKLQNYKKLLDNGLILQGEYDAYKKEILSFL
ncbi:MAG: PH domain-containing protein [Bacteroidota bacterium]